MKNQNNWHLWRYSRIFAYGYSSHPHLKTSGIVQKMFMHENFGKDFQKTCNLIMHVKQKLLSFFYHLKLLNAFTGNNHEIVSKIS